MFQEFISTSGSCTCTLSKNLRTIRNGFPIFFFLEHTPGGKNIWNVIIVSGFTLKEINSKVIKARNHWKIMSRRRRNQAFSILPILLKPRPPFLMEVALGISFLLEKVGRTGCYNGQMWALLDKANKNLIRDSMSVWLLNMVKYWKLLWCDEALSIKWTVLKPQHEWPLWSKIFAVVLLIFNVSTTPRFLWSLVKLDVEPHVVSTLMSPAC